MSRPKHCIINYLGLLAGPPRWYGHERSSTPLGSAATPTRIRRQYLLFLVSNATGQAPGRHPARGTGIPDLKNQADPSPPDPGSSFCTAPSHRPTRARLHCSRKTSVPKNASSPPGTRPHPLDSRPLAGHSTPPLSPLGQFHDPLRPSSAFPFALPIQTTGSAPSTPLAIDSFWS